MIARERAPGQPARGVPRPPQATTEARDAGALRAGLDPRATAGFVVNAWEGSLIRARADRSSDAFDSFFALVFDSLLPGD